VRLRVHAATVNATDTLARSGALVRSQRAFAPPYVPGMDAAGLVDELGEGTDTGLAVGDAVMAIVVPRGSHGAYAEHVVVPAGSVVAAPAGADHVHAATLPMNGLTARMALDALAPTATIAVTGAAGAVGGYVVQLAKAAGLRVVADASPADTDLVRDLGADVVVPRGAGVADRIRAAVPGGVDGVADCSLQCHELLGAVRDGGGIAVMRQETGAAERGITWHRVAVPYIAEDRARLDGLRALVESGAVTLRVAATYPAERAAEAHARLAEGGTRGRLVLTF
jgi:NADPH:quinone reductase-like Zn-dependent oxidoreductase